MKLRCVISSLAFPLFLFGCGGGDGDASPNADYKAPTFEQTSGKIVGTYYTSWSNYYGYTPSQIPAGDLTHIYYAFLAPCPGDKPANEMNSADKQLADVCKGKKVGEAVFADPTAAFGYRNNNGSRYTGDIAHLTKLKTAYPHIKVLPSFGGWDLSGPFHDLIKTQAARDRFVSSSIALLEEHPVFDGIDIDWEFPGGDGATNPDNDPDLALTPEEKAFEKQAFTELMKSFRVSLDALGNRTNRHYELTAAVNASPYYINAIDYKNVSQYMDYFLVMTYDFFVTGRNDAGFHANLHDYGGYMNAGGDRQIEGLLALGVPSEKIIIGANFSGRGWQGVKEDGTSTQPILGKDSATGPMKDAFPTYSDIVSRYLTDSAFYYHYHEQAEAPYLYSPSLEQFISYDDPRSVEAKGKYAVDQQLGGIFAWELRSDNGDLMKAANIGIGNTPIKP